MGPAAPSRERPGPSARVSVRSKLVVAVGCCAATVTLIAVISVSTLSSFRVGGPHYLEVERHFELVADVLPPPMYLVELNLEAHVAAYDRRSSAETAIAGFTALETGWQARVERWTGQIEDEQLQTLVFEGAIPTARAMFDIVDGQLVPALQRGDEAAAQAIVAGELQTAYAEHRRSVDAVVARANELAASSRSATIATSERRELQLVVLAVLAIAIAIAMGVVIVRAVVGPLHLLRSRLDAVADRSARSADPGAPTDEQRLIELDESRRDEFGGIATAFNRYARYATQVEHDLRTRARILADATSSVQHEADEVGEQMAMVAAAVHEMTLAVREVSAAAQEAANIASEAVAAADETSSTMAQLGASTEAIADSVTLIDSLASQTNLLALNATIESARAGDAGRGFAVVADEVKTLAGATTETTEEIRSRVHAVQAGGETATLTLRRIAMVVREVNEVQATIAAAVEEQSASLEQISESVSQAALAASSIRDRLNETTESLRSV